MNTRFSHLYPAFLIGRVSTRRFYGERFGTTGFNKPRRSQSMPRRPGGRDALLASVSTRIAQTEFIPAAGAPSGQPVPPDAYSKFGSSIERIPRRMEPRTMVPSMGLDRRFQTMKHDRKWYTYNDIPRRPRLLGFSSMFDPSVFN